MPRMPVPFGSGGDRLKSGAKAVALSDHGQEQSAQKIDTGVRSKIDAERRQ